MGLVFADTNALIYFLKGNEVMRPFVNDKFAISEISEIELLGVKDITTKDLDLRTSLVKECICLSFNPRHKINCHLTETNERLENSRCINSCHIDIF